MTLLVDLVSNIHEINVKMQPLFAKGDFLAVSINSCLRY